MTTCSALARSLAEPTAGTAPHAVVWLAVEQPGPWGRKALTDSHLPDRLRAVLAEVDTIPGAKAVLVRRPGRHADVRAGDQPRRVVLAGMAGGRRWLREAVSHRQADIDALDLPASVRAAVAGEPPSWGRTTEDPIVLVCTNGRRDRCCAERGRPVALSLAQRHGDAVWESSHLGGHRFAPTTLVLPAGAVYGGLTAGQLDATAAALAAGTLPLDGLRGLSGLDPVQQVADHAVRAERGWLALDATRLDPAIPSDDGGWTVRVHGPGVVVHARVEQVEQPPRPESCGAEPVRRLDLRATLVDRPLG